MTASPKSVSLAERIGEHVRFYFGTRTTGLGSLLWVGAGSVFLTALGVPPNLALPVAAIYPSVRNLDNSGEAPVKIADAVAKAKNVGVPNEPDTKSDE